MSDALTDSNSTPLPALIDRAAACLASARDSAEVLEARDVARVAYDAAKSAGRMARAKKAHEDVIAAVYRAQADALLIEARAKMRLADEYDAAQARGEVAKLGDNLPSVGDHNSKATAADIGLRRDEIYEARKLRDAENAEPGKAERALGDMVARGEEPTKAKLRRELVGVHDETDVLRDQNDAAAREIRSLKDQVETLTQRVAELSATNQGVVIAKLQQQVVAAKHARDKAMQEAARLSRKLRDAERRVAELERTEITL